MSAARALSFSLLRDNAARNTPMASNGEVNVLRPARRCSWEKSPFGIFGFSFFFPWRSSASFIVFFFGSFFFFYTEDGSLTVEMAFCESREIIYRLSFREFFSVWYWLLMGSRLTRWVGSLADGAGQLFVLRFLGRYRGQNFSV